jgi:hypothetical protein
MSTQYVNNIKPLVNEGNDLVRWEREVETYLITVNPVAARHIMHANLGDAIPFPVDASDKAKEKIKLTLQASGGILMSMLSEESKALVLGHDLAAAPMFQYEGLSVLRCIRATHREELSAVTKLARATMILKRLENATQLIDESFSQYMLRVKRMVEECATFGEVVGAARQVQCLVKGVDTTRFGRALVKYNDDRMALTWGELTAHFEKFMTEPAAHAAPDTVEDAALSVGSGNVFASGAPTVNDLQEEVRKLQGQLNYMKRKDGMEIQKRLRTEDGKRICYNYILDDFCRYGEDCHFEHRKAAKEEIARAKSFREGGGGA